MRASTLQRKNSQMGRRIQALKEDKTRAIQTNIRLKWALEEAQRMKDPANQLRRMHQEHPRLVVAVMTMVMILVSAAVIAVTALILSLLN